MLLTSFDPFVEFDHLTQRMFGTTPGTVARPTLMPMDAIRRKDEILLRFDLPGVDPASIDITVDRDVLTVGAQRNEETHEEGENLITRERVTGSFARRVYLGSAFDVDKIEAGYTDGVLSVRVPVQEKARARKIEVHTNGLKKITA